MECSSNQKRVCRPTAVEGLIWYTSVKLLEYNIIQCTWCHHSFWVSSYSLLPPPNLFVLSGFSHWECYWVAPPLGTALPKSRIEYNKKGLFYKLRYSRQSIGLYFMLNSSNYIDKKNLQVDSPVGAEAKSMVLRLPGKMSMCPTIIKLRANVLTNRPYRRLFLTQRSIVGSGEHSWIVLLIRRRRYSSRDGAPRAPLFACPSVCFMSPAKN